MLRLDGPISIPLCGGLSRRDFLHAGSLAFLGMTLPELESLKARGLADSDNDVSCIFLLLLGGVPQLDTWDMKPDAPTEIRGPYRPIATRTPGIQVSQLFPRMAEQSNELALIRSFHHTNPPTAVDADG